MAVETFEDRVSKHPLIKRLRWWLAPILAVIALLGWTVKDFVTAPDSAGPTTQATPTPTSTVPSPKETGGGWGPARTTFTIASPAPYAVLNSITDNPNYGDERNFLMVIPTPKVLTPDPYKDVLKVSPGDRLTFRGYFEDSAADNFEVTAPSWIQGAKAILSYETKPTLQKAIYLSIKADNSATIWDGVVLHSEGLFTLKAINGTARIYNNVHPLKEGGYQFSFDSLQSANGIPLGYESMNGTIRPGYQYAGYIYFEMEVVDAT